MSSTPVAAVVASGKLAEVLPSSSAPAAASLLSPCSRSPSTPAVSLKLVAAGHTRRIRVPADSTFEQLRWEVAELCKITPSDFTIRFQVGDEDHVMSDDRGVRLAFASAATDPSKPIRLSIDLIGRVGLNVGGGRVAVKRKEAVAAAATATAPSADSGSASSSALPQQQTGAVAVAQAAIGMTANQTVALNPQNTDSNARVASPSSTQERASSLPAAVVAPVVVAECVSPSASLARARVHAILVQPYADWSLVHVQQQMKHTAEDRALLPFVNTEMVCEEMQTIVHERQIEAKQRAAIAAAAEEREKKAKAAAASSSAIPQIASAASSSAAAVPSAPLPSESAARLRVRTVLSHPHAAWTLVHVQQQMSFTSDDRALLPFVSQSMLCDEMQTIVIERQIEGKLKAAVAAAEERKVEAARVAASPFSAFAAVSSPSAAVSASPLPVAADSSSSPSSSSSSALSSARSRVREILSAPLAHCSLVHVQHLMQFTAEDRALLPLVNAAMVCEELQAIVHERQLEAKQKLAIAAAAEEKERQTASMADERKEQERQAKAAAAASNASAAQLAALSESIALNPTPLPPALPVAAHAPVASAPASAAASCSVAPAAAAAAAAPALGSWSCAVCTFVNSFPVLQCEVCLALIPEVEAPVAAAVAASIVAPAVAPAVAAPAVVQAAMVVVAPAAASVAVVASAVAPVVESPPAAAVMQPSPVQAPLVIEVEQQSPQPHSAVAVASAPATAVSPISSMSIALLPASSPACPPAAVIVAESAPSASACASSSSSSSYSSLTNSSCSAFTSPSDSPPSDDSPVQPAQDRSPQLDVHQLAEQMERLSQQLRAMQSPSVGAESGSVSSSLSSSAFLLPATPPAPALSPVELASAVSAMSLTMERMAAMQRSHIAEMQRMMAEQMEQAMKRMEAERRLVKRERSNSGKAYRTVSAAIAHRHGRRSVSGVRTQRSTSSLSSSQSSLSSSVPPSPALSSLQSSPQSAPHGAGAGVVVPSLSLISPALAPSTDHLASSLLDSRYVDLMSLSQTDLDHANQSAAASLVGLDDLSTAVEVLPVGAPALQTINSASELESMEETGSATVESFSATPLAQVLSAIPESSSSASFAALSSSSSSSSAPVSGSPSDLSASVDMSSVRFPSVPVVSDRESKLDELAQLGFTNRIFASTLLDANDGCMSTTIANLTQFYGR